MLSLSSWCLVVVLKHFPKKPWACLQFVIEIYPDHSHLRFYSCTVRKLLTLTSSRSRSSKDHKSNKHFRAHIYTAVKQNTRSMTLFFHSRRCLSTVNSNGLCWRDDEGLLKVVFRFSLSLSYLKYISELEPLWQTFLDQRIFWIISRLPPSRKAIDSTAHAWVYK